MSLIFYSLMIPSMMVRVLSVICANSLLWVIMTKVCPKSFRRSKKSLCNASEAFESRFPEGSSARITMGLFMSALAMATLCCSPPDNSPGLLWILGKSPMNPRSSLALFSDFDLFSPAIKAGIQVFSNASNSGNR